MKLEKTDFQLKVIYKIKELRENMKMSQSLLSEKLGISYGLVGNIESPHQTHKYTLKQLYTLSKEFEYPFYKLFLEDDEMDKTKEKLIELFTIKIIEYDSKRENY